MLCAKSPTKVVKHKHRYHLLLLLLLGTLLLSLGLNGYLLVAEPAAWASPPPFVPTDRRTLYAELDQARQELKACQQGLAMRDNASTP